MDGSVVHQMKMKARSNRSVGFSLVEIVITLTLVSLLALLVLPGYRMQVLRSQRIEATTALLAVAAAQEKHFLQRHTYSLDLVTPPPDGLGLQEITRNGLYAITISHADDDGFTATATAVGRQALDTYCSEFSISATGIQTAPHDDCWR